jgi:hypothetical protein
MLDTSKYKRKTIAAARASGIVVSRASGPEDAWALVWYRICKQEHLPYIRITPLRDRAFVVMDLGTVPWRLSAGAQQAVEVAALRACGQLADGKRASITDGPVSWIRRVPLDNAWALAEELRDIARRDMAEASVP